MTEGIRDLIPDPDVARLLQVSKMTIWRWTHDEKFKKFGFPSCIRLGGRNYRSQSALDAWVRDRAMGKMADVAPDEPPDKHDFTPDEHAHVRRIRRGIQRDDEAPSRTRRAETPEERNHRLAKAQEKRDRERAELRAYHKLQAEAETYLEEGE